MHLKTEYDWIYVPAQGEFNSTWHGLETQVDGGIQLDGSNIPRVFCPIIQTGFKPDFAAEISNVPAELAQYLGDNPLTDWKVILADLRTNEHGIIPVHVAKHGYTVHDNRRIFDAMVKAVLKVLGEQFEIATVGTLGAYSQFMVSIALKGELAGFSIGG